MTYSNLGWLSIIIVGVLLLPYVLNFLSRNLFKTKNAYYRKTIKFLRKLHKPLGVSLLIIGLIHGYMALGSIKLHTGTFLYLSVLATAALGGSFYRLKKRKLFIWHKRMALLTVIIFLIHFFFPGAIYYLLN